MFRTSEELRWLCLELPATVDQAVRKLDEQRFGIVVVVDSIQRLQGILTNGDFRRFILAGGRLKAPIEHAMNTSPVTATASPGLLDELAQCFAAKDILYVPILDPTRTVLDVALLNDISDHADAKVLQLLPESCPVIIMAGGKGTRLDPFTKVLPKPLIPVGDKPIVEVITDRFAAAGVRHFWVSLNHKGRMIRAYFENAPVGYDISYLEEDRPLGTAGALRLLEGRLKSSFFVTNCDILILADYGSIYDTHMREGNDLTIVGSVRCHTIPYGVCELGKQGKLVRLVEKPTYDVLVNTGMYVVQPTLLRFIPEGRPMDMDELIKVALGEGRKVGVYPVTESSWLDVGQWEEYRETVSRLEHNQW
ncbi:nucleotidyltransferase family protein [Acidobacteriota bacterium]